MTALPIAPAAQPLSDTRSARHAALTAMLDLAAEYATSCKPVMRRSIEANVSQWRKTIRHADRGMLGPNGYAPGVGACLRAAKIQAQMAAEVVGVAA